MTGPYNNDGLVGLHVLVTGVMVSIAFGIGANAGLTVWLAYPILFAIYSFLAAFFRMGWLVPCTILSPWLGIMFLSPAVRGGSHESRMWEDIRIAALGLLIGLVVGVVLECRQNSKNTMTKNPQEPAE